MMAITFAKREACDVDLYLSTAQKSCNSSRGKRPSPQALRRESHTTVSDDKICQLSEIELAIAAMNTMTKEELKAKYADI